jgi:Sulfotransferase domain
MTLRVIGFGVGRTGTFSMKLALEQLGFGPCHHMEEVDIEKPEQIALWASAAQGKVNWEKAYTGYSSAVDWPTAAFCKELSEAYPNAKCILTIREPEKWYTSFSQTIVPLLHPTEKTPPLLLPFIAMAGAVVQKTGFNLSGSKEDILAAFHRHIETVKKTIPENRLLVFDVKQGWGPLCEYLGVPIPLGDFPKTNNTKDFWDSVQADGAAAV